MVKRLLVFFIFWTFTSCFLEQADELCKYTKDQLNKFISIYGEMTEKDRQQLHVYSLRVAAGVIVKKAKYTDQDLKAAARALVDEVEPLREQFRKQHHSFTPQKLVQIAVKMNSEMTALRKKMNQEFSYHRSLMKQYKEKLEEIKALVANMLNEDEQFHQKSEKLQKLNSLKTLVDNIESSSEDFEVIFQEVDELEGDPQAKIRQQTAIFRVKYKNYFLVNRLVSVIAKTQDGLGLAQNDSIKSDLSKLKKSQSKLKGELSDLKKSLEKEIKAMISDLKIEILNNQDYNNYLERLGEAKDMIEKLVGSQVIHNQYKVRISKRIKKIEAIGFLTARIHRSDLVDLQSDLIKLEHTMKRVTEEYNDGLVQDITLIPAVKEYYMHNTTRLPQMQEIHTKLQDRLDLLRALDEKEIEIDEHLGRLFAELQGGLDSGEGFVKCFSPLEISVYFYYMNVMQVIYSKKRFFAEFIGNLSHNDQLIMVKQVFNDLTSDVFVDQQMIDFYTGDFAEEGIQKSIDNFGLISENELDLIFEKQLSEKKKSKGLLYKVLHYAGITAKVVLKVVANGTLNHLCKHLVEAIFSVLSFCAAPVFLVVFISTLLALLVELFVKWVWGKVSNSASVLYQFNRGLAWVASIFDEKQPESLDFEDVLKKKNHKEYMLQLKSRKKATAKAAEKTKYFYNLFKDIIKYSSQKEEIRYLVI